MNKLLFLLLLTLPSCAVVTTSDPQWQYPHFAAGSYLGKKIPNYHPEKYAGPTTGHAVFWGRGAPFYRGGRSL